MKLPRKGEYVSLKKIKELCIYFELYDLWDKIESDPPPKPFKSDGCSCWPDNWKNAKGKKVSIYKACFLHDIFYWAGYKGEIMARFLADAKLMIDVAKKTGRPKLALTMLAGIRAGGSSWTHLPFRWGFGRY